MASLAKQNILGAVLLCLALVCASILTAMGVLTKSELLPVLGGVVVVAHRLIEPVARQMATDRTDRRASKPPPSIGMGVLLGMAAGGALSVLDLV